MIQVVTKTANHQSKALNLTKHFPPLGRRENREHHLSDVERMSPVVISHVTIVLLDAQQPSTEHLVVDVKALH